MVTVEECEKWIRPHLGDARFYHSQCVSKEAGKLAKQYGADVYKAEIAGMLHDICKETLPQEQLKIIDRFGIIMSETERKVVRLYHAISGAAYVQHILGIDDQEIVNAIRWHTSGHANMTLLEKVIFVADFNSADRTYSGVEDMRTLAKSSLEKAMVYGIAFTVKEILDRNTQIDVNTIEAYNDALVVLEKENQG